MRRLVFALFFGLVWSMAPAQQQPDDFNTFNPRFEVFELPGGVPGNSITSMVQDSTGFLWFGSQAGLYRYDGQNFRIWSYDPANPNSLSSDIVEYILIDSRGILWLAHFSDGGVTAFDPATETFTRYHHDPKDPESLSSNTNSVITEDRQGYIWVGGVSGLDRFDRKTGKFKRFHHNPDDPRSLSHDNVRALYVDKQGTLWVGTGFFVPIDGLGGLNRYDPKTQTFTRYMHDPKDPKSLINNKVRAIFEDSRGNFWVGTSDDGLHLMDRKSGTFTRLNYDPANPAKLSRPFLRGLAPADHIIYHHVSSVFEDAEGLIWITAFPGGLNVYDPESGVTRHFEAGKEVGELTTNYLWQVFQTRDGALWMASAGDGKTVFKVKKPDRRFRFFDWKKAGLELGNRVMGFVKDPSGDFWAGFTNGLPTLVRYDLKTGRVFPVSTDADLGASSSVNYLYLDRGGFLWVSTFEDGLFRRDPKTGKMRQYLPQIVNSVFRPFLQDRTGSVWAANSGYLYRLNPETGEFATFRHDPNNPGSIDGKSIVALYEDLNGNIWAGGSNQQNAKERWAFLDRFDAESKTFTHFIKEKKAGSVQSINGDEKGNILFVDNLAQLQKLNPTDGSLQKFSAQQVNLVRVPLEITISNLTLAKGKEGRFWLYDVNRLLEFDPQTERLYAHDETHGVPAVGINRSNLFVAGDGEILIAGGDGILAFYPEKIAPAKNALPPNLRITGFHLLDKPVLPGENSLLKKPIWQTTELRLTHQQNVFAFSVACFDFYNPAAVQLQFMLEGYDRTGWRTDLRNGQTPPYVNVPPGEYTLRVRGADSHGVWNLEGISLKINVLPPWWKTWWAYSLYLLALAGGIFWYNAHRTAAFIRENKILENKVVLRTGELQTSLENLKSTQSQLIQSEKLASLGELTAGIAHEIQNPLNFVNNFSELSMELAQELREELEKPDPDKPLVQELVNDLSQNQQKINHHGKRAASIVTGMLQHARTSTGKKEPTDLNALADEYLRLSYHGLRAKDVSFNAKIITNFDPAIGKVEVIPQDMGRVLLNLINNAFYAVNQRKANVGRVLNPADVGTGVGGYEPTVTVSSRLMDSGRVEIRIRDNGTGIPDSAKAKIFQPFFTTKPAGEGTGLGLSLAYDIVTKGHGGTMEVESVEGEGTEFVIQLPI